jgi:hypothetical protein
MVRRSPPARSFYEARFPHKVEVSTPPMGRGRRLDEMIGWCRDRSGGDSQRWGVYGASFYFCDEADAAAFRDAWLEPVDKLPAPGGAEAIEQGCTCDPEENLNGAGHRQPDGQRLWHADYACPVHGINFALAEVEAGHANILHDEPGNKNDEDEEKLN